MHKLINFAVNRKKKINIKPFSITTRHTVPDSVKSPVILENEGIVFADVNPRNNVIEAKISLPQTKCFMVLDFLKKNPHTQNHCSKCVNRFKELGNDFLQMAKTNLVSELLFHLTYKELP